MTLPHRFSSPIFRLSLPVALLATFLQRAPLPRLAALAGRVVAAPVGQWLRPALAATASLGALHTLAGATAFVRSPEGTISGTVGTPISVAFTYVGTPSAPARFVFAGTLPPGLRFVPTPNGNTIPSGAPAITGTPTQSGTFAVQVQGFNPEGLTNGVQQIIDFEIIAPGTAPSISAQPQSQSVATGASVTFTVAASGTPTPAIQWRKDGVAIAGATGATLTLPNVSAASAGTYTALVTNTAGTVTTAAAVLTVAPPAAGTIAAAISAHPAAQTIASGSTVVFSAGATGTPAPAYQWRRDGVAIAGATGPVLVVNAATAANAGLYTVVATNSAGTATSTAAALTVTNTDATAVGRLANLSILTTAGSGAKVLTIGATVGGAGTGGALPLVIRAIGPTLGTAFGLGDVLADPVISINVAGNATPFATNDDWGGGAGLASAFASVAAFSLPANSLDAAIVPPAPGLAAGGYTVQVAGKGGATGTVIAEMYDAAAARTAATPRLTNLSTLTDIGAGTNLAVGFVIGGTTARTLLVRGVGPTLASAFGLGGTMTDPKLELFNNATGVKISENNDWAGDTSLVNTQASVGAFALANASSKDAVLLVTLAPGQYSARVSGADGGGGTAIVEVYEVP
jgi:hypothetical protein